MASKTGLLNKTSKRPTEEALEGLCRVKGQLWAKWKKIIEEAKTHERL